MFHTRPKSPAGGVRPAAAGHPGRHASRRAPACRPPARSPRNSAWRARPSCWPMSAWRPRAMSAPAPAAAPMSPRSAGRRACPGCAAARRGQSAVRARPTPGRVPASAASRDTGLGTLLAGGIPAPDLFPTQAWARCAARVLKTLSSDLTGYPPPQGLAELRAQIAAHLAATRGLLADPANIVVTAGTQQALRIAAELLLDPGDAAWVEDPGYIAGRGALLAAGAAPVAGAERRRGARCRRRHPAARPPRGWRWWRRRMPRRWAARCRSAGGWRCWTGPARANAWVLEDDCDSEFRWTGHPLPPLATLDRAGRVIYCGTFSKTLAPALRLGFAVVPAPLVAAFVRRADADGSRHRHAQPGDPGRVHAPGPARAAYPPHAHRVCPPPRRPAGRDRPPRTVRSRRSRLPAGCTWSARLPDGMDEAAVGTGLPQPWPRGVAAAAPTTPARRGCRGWSWGSPARPRRWPPIRRGGWRRVADGGVVSGVALFH